jgi:DNA-binding PadR family transcriptional regulator
MITHVHYRILRTLSEKPARAKKLVGRASSNYAALHKLTYMGLAEFYKEVQTDGRPAKMYKITPLGTRLWSVLKEIEL